jgi:cystathionine beta-lyase/cystathionine gamma-synthase
MCQEFIAAQRLETRLIYVESPSNPLLRCVDLAAIAALGRARGLLTVIDNTFATPINQNPIELGFDAVVHSAMKYLNGHSDVNAGVVVSSVSVIHELTEGAMLYVGMLDAQSCYQLERGLKPLALRVRQHNENAGRLAQYLQRHSAVAHVNYPGLGRASGSRKRRAADAGFWRHAVVRAARHGAGGVTPRCQWSYRLVTRRPRPVTCH